MTVRELIKELNAVENKDLPVFMYDTCDILDIDEVDELNDRVDINVSG